MASPGHRQPGEGPLVAGKLNLITDPAESSNSVAVIDSREALAIDSAVAAWRRDYQATTLERQPLRQPLADAPMGTISTPGT